VSFEVSWVSFFFYGCDSLVCKITDIALVPAPLHQKPMILSSKKPKNQ
jgi:hypothetical protein